MEQKTLKYLRVLIPGLIVLIGLLPMKDKLVSNISVIQSLDYNYMILISLIIGSIYYQLNIQHIITRISHYFIAINIYKKIISMHDNLNESQKKKIWRDGLYKDIFYRIIDNDESLRRKGLNVKFNGIFWTSSADLSLISIIYWFLYKFNMLKIEFNKEVASVFLIISCLSLFLHIISVIKHITLSNEQLNMIINHFKMDVKTSLNEILGIES